MAKGIPVFKNLLQTALRWLFSPLVFSLAFLAPLTTQTLIALELMESGTSAMIAGLIAGGALGLVAQLRGSWIWIK